MRAASLLAEITQAFQDVPRPDGQHLVTNNQPGYDLESLQIQASFRPYIWQTIPDELLLHERAALSFLSPPGLRYYLPAFMQFAVRAYWEADTIPDDLVYDFTLPVEVDVLAAAQASELYRSLVPGAVSDRAYYRKLLRRSNERVHFFFSRWGLLNRAQGRAILHFLEYVRDEHGPDYLHDEPATAITRYWFQFA